ncbi:hypothetical protein O3P69_016311 [Scylla paramamosain]|uniref:Uncharacterized protein n=1 Tax=Scylla paramamosain TaxID=85552 RepID=A0AAW0TE27_SCYPA
MHEAVAGWLAGWLAGGSTALKNPVRDERARTSGEGREKTQFLIRCPAQTRPTLPIPDPPPVSRLIITHGYTRYSPQPSPAACVYSALNLSLLLRPGPLASSSSLPPPHLHPPSHLILLHLGHHLISASFSSQPLSHLSLYLISASFSSQPPSHLSLYLISASSSSQPLSHLSLLLIQPPPHIQSSISS